MDGAHDQPRYAGVSGTHGLGLRTWVIAEGYIPEGGNEASRDLASHEVACLLNTGDADAHVDILLYFTDREPVGPYRLVVPARRTLHLRFNDLREPEAVPRGTDFSSVIRSDVPIVVQHSRLDSRPQPHALMTTLAFGIPGA